MVAFFFPTPDGSPTEPEKGEEYYAGCVKYAEKATGFKVSNTRVYSLRWSHNGNSHQATVGKPTSFNDQIVVAILETDGSAPFLIFTPTRGLAGNQGPILADAEGQAVYFD